MGKCNGSFVKPFAAANRQMARPTCWKREAETDFGCFWMRLLLQDVSERERSWQFIEERFLTNPVAVIFDVIWLDSATKIRSQQ